jgi:hypothetical protein
VLQCFKELLEALCAAIRQQVSMAHSSKNWAVHYDVLYHLDRFTILACNLVWSVLREESLCVFSCKSMPCDEMVKSRVG